MKRIAVVVLAAMLMTVGMAIGEAETWTCPACGSENTGNFCGQDGTERPSWVCEVCGKTNFDESSKFCGFCAAPRAADADAEWTCLICGKVNAADTIYCGNCSAEKGAEPQKYEVGDIVTFGSYEQDGDESNGAESIEWQVLDDYGDGMYVVISAKGLDTVWFNKSANDGNDWESSYAKYWLNVKFYKTAFSNEEKAMITPGPTNNNVWLLSIDEAEQYFADKASRVCYATQKAINDGAYKNTSGACYWWLRSSGLDLRMAASVDDSGFVNSSGSFVYNTELCVRPVVCVRLS